MFGSNILEICIGLILVFLIVAVICTAIREGLESWLKTRSAYLERGIRLLVNDLNGSGLAKSIYNHPLIYGLYWGEYKSGSAGKDAPVFARGGNLPAYIPTKNFALALMDIVAKGPDPDAAGAIGNEHISLDAIKANINSLGDPQIRRVLTSALLVAQNDINKYQKFLEEWYDGSMDRVSGWYKRSTQKIIFLIAITASVGLNVNAIRMVNYLAQNEAARKLIVESATTVSKDSTATKMEAGAAREQLNSLNLPIGWDNGKESAYIKANDDSSWNTIFGPLLGWIITALAATLGAPFWFDMLNKIIVIRSTVKPDEKSPEEASKDSGPKPLKAVIVPPAEEGGAAND